MTGDLIEKLEKAEAGSRELDVFVIAEIFPNSYDSAINYHLWSEYADRIAKPVTTSLDAALALAERVLPGWAFVLSTGNSENPAWVQAYPFPATEDDYCDAEVGATLPLTLCIAILKARTAASSSSPGTVQGGEK